MVPALQYRPSRQGVRKARQEDRRRPASKHRHQRGRPDQDHLHGLVARTGGQLRKGRRLPPKQSISRYAVCHSAPEECIEQFLRKGEYPPGINRNVAEAFSIGLTLLEAASLKNCSDIYSKNGDFNVNQDTLRRIVESTRANSYSPYLINTIDSLITIDPKARPSCG